MSSRGIKPSNFSFIFLKYIDNKVPYHQGMVNLIYIKIAMKMK